MERAYDEIKRRIIALELAPGKRIDEQALSLELALSRTPVREAIFRLAAEGFVELRAKAGFVVRPIELLDVAHLFEAHIVLAKAVARLAARRSTTQQLEELRIAKEAVSAAIERRDYLAMSSSNAQLHRLEAEAAHNLHIQAMAKSIHDHGQRLAYLCYGGSGSDTGAELDAHLGKVMRDHDRMLVALEKRDPEAAERIAVDHVQLFRRRVARFIESDSLSDYRLTDEDIESVGFSAELTLGRTRAPRAGGRQ
jgi:DNA-binding GntR family transcriptional regulator